MRKLKNFIKKIIPGGFLNLRRNIRSIFVRIETLERNQLSLLRERYGAESKSDLNSKEFKIYSQNGEDGVLLYIFSKIGIKNKKLVEIGIEEGKECNSANLIINFGWNGLLIDGDQRGIISAKYYYKHVKGISDSRLKIVNKFVTKENVNNIFKENGIEGEIDMLSIDIDGNDYWILEAINVINPRVIIMEYNASIPKDKSLSVKYDPHFDRFVKHESAGYHGASLKAITKLANQKGYILVGCESTGCNAFFVRKDLAKGKLEEVSVEDAYYPQIYRVKHSSLEDQFDQIIQLDFQEV
jgi:hypothetical protein